MQGPASLSGSLSRGSDEGMFLGEDVLPGFSFRSAQAEPANLTVGGWVIGWHSL